jgi:hypothetical protein
MENDKFISIVGLTILAIVILGGATGGPIVAPTNNGTSTGIQNSNIEYQLAEAQRKADNIQTQIKEEQEKKISSEFKGKILLSWGSQSDNPTYEYLILRADNQNKQPVNITGWRLTSTVTGNTSTIGKAVKLYFSNSQNVEEDVLLSPGQTAYIITGTSPIGFGFRVNKCSGFLEQFNDFTPGLYTLCPGFFDEYLKTVPRNIPNENCYNLVRYYPSCTVQTQPLSNAYSPECQSFVYSKINYPHCVDVYKSDKDFYSNEWRIYLKRSQSLWRTGREEIVLYDTLGKKVGSIQRDNY